MYSAKVAVGDEAYAELLRLLLCPVSGSGSEQGRGNAKPIDGRLIALIISVVLAALLSIVLAGFLVIQSLRYKLRQASSSVRLSCQHVFHFSMSHCIVRTCCSGKAHGVGDTFSPFKALF